MLILPYIFYGEKCKKDQPPFYQWLVFFGLTRSSTLGAVDDDTGVFKRNGSVDLVDDLVQYL